MNFNNKNIKSIIGAGDLHGQIESLVFKLQEQYKITDSVCFCAGDIGLGFYKENYYLNLFKQLNNKLSKKNNTLLLIRGNHDDPGYWTTEKFNTSNILLIPDYTIVTVNDKKVLCVGGAISIDRTLRKDGIDYWKNENFTFKEDKLNQVTADIVITHSAPTFCFPNSKSEIKYWLEKDHNLEKDIDQERDFHNNLYYKLILNGHHPTKWIYGHFHNSCNHRINETDFILLNELELAELVRF